MAYVNIPSSDYDPESPGSTSLFSAIINNFDGLAAGDAGAPKVQATALEQGAGSQAVITAALRDLAVTEPKIAAGAVTEGKLGTDSVNPLKIELMYLGDVHTPPLLNSTFSVGTGTTTPVSTGAWLFAFNGAIGMLLEMKDSVGTWRIVSTEGGFAFSDSVSSNVRLRNTSAGSITVYYHFYY